MKLLLFSGTHPRHLFVNQEIIKHFDQSLVIVMEREGLIPNPPLDISDNDKYNFIKHFNNREKKENAAYSKLSYLDVFKDQKKVLTFLLKMLRTKKKVHLYLIKI